jgi:hypothetical protein
MSWPVLVEYEDGTKDSFASMDHVPKDRPVRCLRGPAFREDCIVLADLSRGETVRRWQTQAKAVLGPGPDVSVPSFAIFRDGQPVCFLYFPPDGMPRLSTREMRWP